ncbi:MAG: hypothetical protein HQK54_05255 [Oligoflexales bacterium]|nr:hypothetical protein [Oligoflexales bacterium]
MIFGASLLALNLGLETSYHKIPEIADPRKDSYVHRVGGDMTLGGDSPYQMLSSGDCYLIDGELMAARPRAARFDQEKKRFCQLRELYGQSSDLDYKIKIGKQGIGISQAQISSPANPLRAGLIQGGIWGRHEGIPIIWMEMTWDVWGNFAFALASDGKFGNPEPLLFGRLTHSMADLSMILTRKFLGLAVRGPVGDNIILYSEANLHGVNDEPTEMTPVYRDLYSDALLGMSISSYVADGGSYTLAIEYLLNSHGISEKLSSDGLRVISNIAGEKDIRKAYYNFPSSEEEKVSDWPWGDFLSRNYLFLNLYRNDANLGLNLNYLWNMVDRGGRIQAGYRYKNLSHPFLTPFIIGIAYIHYHGAELSEYGQAAQVYGKNHYQISLEYNL